MKTKRSRLHILLPALLLLGLGLPFAIAARVAHAEAPAPAVVLHEGVTLSTATPMAVDTATPATTSTPVGGDAVPADVGAAVNELPAIAAAAHNGEWGMVIGMVLGILILLWERYGTASGIVDSRTIHWIQFAADVLGAVALGLVHHAPLVAIVAGALSALVAGITTYHVLDERLPDVVPKGAHP